MTDSDRVHPDAPSGSAILVRNAKKLYKGGREAVIDVSLDVAAGTVHGLLGPNGAGKTTTLKMLLGLVSPSGGSFEILGEPAGPDVRARVGFLAEQPYFPALLTAEQVMSFAGRLAGMERAAITERSRALLARVGLESSATTTVSRFSRGMLQRLGVAQALIASPELLILDEPASGLDPVGQRDIRNLILEQRDAGTTVLLSSHQLSEVEAVCDQVTIVNKGRVARRGPIDELLAVAGRCTVTARSEQPALPAGLDRVVGDVVASGGAWTFSIPAEESRKIVDALDDAGWALESLVPTRVSLEDYFTRLVAEGHAEVSS